MERSNPLPDFDTSCARSGTGSGDAAPLVPAIVQSTTFCRDRVGSTAEHQYSRVSNPTVATLEDALAHLENAVGAVCFSTGLAAETALFLALLKAGDHLVCGRTVYGGTTRLAQSLLTDLGVAVTLVDATDPDRIRSALRPETRLLFVETPANPTLELTDIRAVAAIARDGGIPLAVDNTFLTPVLQQPLDLGADVSVYSTTKFLEGHSVALGGALVARDEALLERLRFIRKSTGAIQTPFNAWLTLLGLRTLPLRIRRQSETADAVARWLSQRPEVLKVRYPGLDGPRAQMEITPARTALAHIAQAEIARAQHLGAHGAVVSFELKGGVDSARMFVERLELCRLVEHVGSVETLVTHPATMTHADVPREDRMAAGIGDGLLRLSVGLESPSAILSDLQGALGSHPSTRCDTREVTACPAGV